LVETAEFGVTALADEERAGAVGRHDAEAAEGVRDEPDEAA
jgi:hypothetical protein